MHPVADLRERAASFLREFCNFAIEGNAIVRAIGVTAGAVVCVTLVSNPVGDSTAPVIGLAVAVGLSSLLVVSSNPNPDVPVRSSTAAKAAGVMTSRHRRLHNSGGEIPHRRIHAVPGR
jgi:hypothetical protein